MWQHEINIKPIHAAYRETEDLEVMKVAMGQECRQLADRISTQPDYGILRGLANRFEKYVDDIDKYDEVLKDLYDWGDHDHKCWINSF